MTDAIMQLSAFCEAQILMEKSQMTCPVESDEQQQNSGMTEAYYDDLDARASEMADANIYDPASVTDASDYPLFFSHLTLALTATNNDERLRWLATIRDAVHSRIKSAAREELRKADLQGEEP